MGNFLFEMFFGIVLIGITASGIWYMDYGIKKIREKYSKKTN